MTTKTPPLLFADDRADAEKFNPRLHRGSLDPSRVPGYSETVQANDIDVADALWFRENNAGRTKEDYFKEIGAAPSALPVEFMWLPISGPGGGAMSSAQLRQLDAYTTQQGFRVVLGEVSEDGDPSLPSYLRDLGYGFPSQARLAEDGTIRRGPDTALYVRSGEVAKMWKEFRETEQAELERRKPPEAFSAGAYTAETFSEKERRETITLKH